jgi:hypothetical protein
MSKSAQRGARYRKRLTDARGLRRVEVVVPAESVADLKTYAQRLRELALRRRRPNPEAINDRAKLLHHRLIARRLRHRPELLDKARELVATWVRERPAQDDAHLWAELLRRPVAEVCRLIIARSHEASRLRLGSPFRFVPELRIVDEPLRRRLWQLARRRFEASKTSIARSGRSPTTSGPTRSS